MATNQEQDAAIEANGLALAELRTDVQNALGEIRLSLSDLSERVTASGSLSEGAADELATLRARIEEVNTALGSNDGNFASGDRVDALERDMIALAERAPAPTPAGGTISEGAYELPRVGFEGGLTQFVIEKYFGSEIARYLNAAPLENKEEQAA